MTPNPMALSARFRAIFYRQDIEKAFHHRRSMLPSNMERIFDGLSNNPCPTMVFAPQATLQALVVLAVSLRLMIPYTIQAIPLFATTILHCLHRSHHYIPKRPRYRTKTLTRSKQQKTIAKSNGQCSYVCISEKLPS